MRTMERTTDGDRSGTPPADPAWSVACLCAAWCRTCDEYRPTFDGLAAEFGDRAGFVWVDIEDRADALGDVDVVDFPTLLISRGDEIRFFGPVLPQAGQARQLVARALALELEVVGDPALTGLPGRLARS